MSIKTFAESVTEIAATTVTEGAIEHAPPAPVAVVAASPMSDFEGEISRSDVKVPRLQLAQSIGPLSDDFPSGTWVINKRTAIAAKDEPMSIVPLRAVKYYQEKLDYSVSGPMPRRFSTMDDVTAAGLRADWGPDSEPPQIQECLDLTLLIESRSSTPSPEFSFVFDGKCYALISWSITSYTAYDAAARPLLSARTLYLPSFHARRWNLASEKHVMKNGNSTMRPSLVAADPTSEAFQAWSGGLL
tara:strand:- start:6147 stop:6881 length:735 start_codon:yes stop_codon:yes gene_type:complete